MHLVVDAQALQTSASRRRGVGRYARHLLEEISRRRPEWRVEAILNATLPPPEPPDLDRGVTVIQFQPPLPANGSTLEANERYFGDWLASRGPDAVLELSFFEDEALVPLFTLPRPMVVGVAYDLIPIIFHEHYLNDSRRMAHYERRLRQFVQADLMLAISEATRKDVLQLLRWPESRVVTIFGAADPGADGAPPAPETSAAVLRDLALDRPFFLCVGGVDRRKNVRGAVAAFAALPTAIRESHLLVIVGSIDGGAGSEIRREAGRLGIDRQLRLTGFVDDGTLGILYRACRVSIFPSHYEGLGLPVLEALSRGAPVVASDRSGIPAFAGSVSRLADPDDPTTLADAILETLAEPRETRLEERRRTASAFTWARTAELALTAIQTSRRGPGPAAPARRPRVAWVSPLPPTRSGIADYSAEMLFRLRDELDIDLVISPEATRDPGLAGEFKMFRPDEVLAKQDEHPHDLFVYHLGNHEIHIYMLGLQRRYPGLLVLHDVYLGGLALRASEVGAWAGGLASDLDLEGATALAEAVRSGEADHGRIVAEATFSRRFIDTSDAVVVHSASSWAQVRRGAPDLPVYRIGMGVPWTARVSPAAARARLGLPAGEFVVATLGEVTPAKRVDRLIVAAGHLPERIRARLQLLVVGDAPAACARELHSVADGAGLGGRIRFLGRVPLDDLGLFGRAADACVQLRYPTRGETSAALLRALAAGSACIVSDGGSVGELPADVALRIRTPEHEVDDLVAALMRLHDDEDLRANVREAAIRFIESHHDLDECARRYAAVIRLTIARRTRLDGAWRDAASAALAEASRSAVMDAAVLERWATVRAAARAALVGG